MEGVKEDIKLLIAKFSHDEKQLSRDEQQLNLKRRWLMGITTSSNEEKRLKASISENDRVMPELLLREDDVHCDTIRSSIEKGLKVNDGKRELSPIESITQLHNSCNNTGRIFSLLDAMTSEALCSIAEILASGSLRFEKIRWKSRKIIKNYIAELLRRPTNCQYIKQSDRLYKLLKDPNNFLCDQVTLPTSASQSYCAAVEKILDGLDDLHALTILSMNRKLRGVEGYVPQVQTKRRGMKKVVDIVRKRCIEMISDLREGDEQPEQLNKAMVVACLGFKLIGREPPVKEFQHFPTKIEALQNKIIKAITILDLKKKVSISNLKKVKLLLDPTAELSNKSLRPGIRKILINYLLECNDMELAPECLNDCLNIIIGCSPNTSRRSFTKAEVEEEVECVLSVSAQTKQIAWDLLPEHEFDQGFADAYVEDLEDSDDGEGWDDDKSQVEHLTCNKLQEKRLQVVTNDQREDVYETCSINSMGLESIGGCSSPTNPMDTVECEVDSVFSAQRNSVHLLDERLKCYSAQNGSRMRSAKPPKFVSSNFSVGKESFMHDESGMTRNQYLAVQKVCDKTSSVAYQMIGHLLNAFAQLEGKKLRWDEVSYLRGSDSFLNKFQDIEKASVDPSSIFLQLLEELMPNFSESGKDKAKHLMGLK